MIAYPPDHPPAHVQLDICESVSLFALYSRINADRHKQRVLELSSCACYRHPYDETDKGAG